MYYILPSARFLEIHSVLHSSATNILLVREWHTIPGKPGHLAHPINPPPPLLHQPYTPLASQQWHRLITEPARSTNGTHARRLILCTTMCPTPYPAAPLCTRLHPTIQQFIADLTRLQHSTGHQYTLFTDGAYACNELPLAAILQSEFERRQHSCAAAAIIAIGPPAHWRSLPILALALTPSAESLTGSSSYTTELLALAIATISCHAVQHPTLPPLSIYSDCQAAIATTLAACTPLARQRQHGKIHVITDCLQGYPPPRITWTRSHPERRSHDTTKWSYNDWGIHIADAIAGQHDALALLPTVTIHQHYLDCTTAIQSLLPPATWHWTHHNEHRPMLCSPLELVQLRRVRMYLHTRDTRWRAATLPPRWQGTSLTLAAKGWRLLGHNPITFGSTTLRHCLDKCWHGRNRSKGQLDPTAAAQALACPLCAQPEDQMHSILHCPHSDAADIRRTAYEELSQEADSLLRTLSGPDLPLLTRLIRFIVTTSHQHHYPHLDRIWLAPGMTMYATASPSPPHQMTAHLTC